MNNSSPIKAPPRIQPPPFIDTSVQPVPVHPKHHYTTLWFILILVTLCTAGSAFTLGMILGRNSSDRSLSNHIATEYYLVPFDQRITLSKLANDFFEQQTQYYLNQPDGYNKMMGVEEFADGTERMRDFKDLTFFEQERWALLTKQPPPN